MLRCDADQRATVTGHRQNFAKSPAIPYGPHRHVQCNMPVKERLLTPVGMQT